MAFLFCEIFSYNIFLSNVISEEHLIYCLYVSSMLLRIQVVHMILLLFEANAFYWYFRRLIVSVLSFTTISICVNVVGYSIGICVGIHDTGLCMCVCVCQSCNKS